MTAPTRRPLVRLDPKLDEALKRGPVLTPTRRLARELANAFDQGRQNENAACWPSADAMSVEAYLQRCYLECQDAGLAGTDETLLPDAMLPFAVARAAPRADWRRHVDAFADAWRIAHHYDVPDTEPRLADTENGRVYARWAAALKELLADEGWITNAELPNRLIRLIDGPGKWRPEAPTAYGLDDAPAAISRFLAASRAQDMPIPHCEAAHSLRVVGSIRSHDGQAAQGANAGAELALAAAWARERLAQAPESRIGVVVAALGPAYAAIERRFHAAFADLPDVRAAVNLSGGLSLGQEPLCRDALELLTFTVDGLDHDAMVSLAASPFLELPLPPRLPRRARLAELTSVPGLHRLHRIVEDAARSGRWTEAVRRLLAEVRWQDAGARGGTPRKSSNADPRETLARHHFHECLRDLDDAIEVAAIGTWPEAVDALKRLVATRLFAPPGSDQAAIQVLGRAESIGLSFDHLWLAGMHQGGWPAVPEPNPLIPVAIQRAVGAAHASLAQESARAERMTVHWRHAAPDVVASLTPQPEQTRAPLRAKLIADFEPAAAAELLDRPELAARGHPWAVSRGVDLAQSPAIVAHVPPDADESQRGGATVLRDQSLCPFRAWSRHRLDLREAAPTDRFPSEGERGRLVHDVLAELCRRTPDGAELAQTPRHAIEAVVESTLPKHRWPTPYRDRERQRVTALVLEWQSAESRRQPFKVAALESAVSISLHGLELSLRIDRLDAVAADETGRQPTSGGDLLIDFKTGQVSTNQWLGPRPEDPQLPLYAVAVGKQAIRGVAFARVRTEACRLVGVADRDAIKGGLASAERLADLSFDALMDEWESTMSALAEQFASGHAEVDPLRPTVCRRCHLHALCRVFE